jgi:hypothetical protein
MIALPASEWEAFGQMSAKELARGCVRPFGQFRFGREYYELLFTEESKVITLNEHGSVSYGECRQTTEEPEPCLTFPLSTPTTLAQIRSAGNR